MRGYPARKARLATNCMIQFAIKAINLGQIMANYAEGFNLNPL